MTFMLQNDLSHIFKKKKTAEFLASDECYYKDLPASHHKSLLWADALHPACCYFQIPAGVWAIHSFCVSVSNSRFPDKLVFVPLMPSGSLRSQACSSFITNQVFSMSRLTQLDVKHSSASIQVWIKVVSMLFPSPQSTVQRKMSWKIVLCLYLCCTKVIECKGHGENIADNGQSTH